MAFEEVILGVLLGAGIAWAIWYYTHKEMPRNKIRKKNAMEWYGTLTEKQQRDFLLYIPRYDRDFEDLRNHISPTKKDKK